jgi:hypothetical protein
MKVWVARSLSTAVALTAGSSLAAADAGTPPSPGPSACIEHIPEGKSRPQFQESFPARSKAGYAAVLEIKVPHGLGETVLPGGFKLQLDSAEGKALKASQFIVPALDGPSGPRLTRTEVESSALTTVELSFVPLPDEPGPHTLTLPSLPIAISRASGEMLTVCTHPHVLQVDDPTANTAHAKPRRNPPPRRQLEVWTAAKNVALGALIALPLGLLLAFLFTRWLNREKPLPPPPPPRPPWDVALEALARVRRDRLIDQGLTTEHFVEVSLALRKYLGDRFGFDGLESTTREILMALKQARTQSEVLTEAEHLLRRADLVKFANLEPQAAECEIALERSEQLVRRTMVRERPAADLDAVRPAAPSGSEGDL